MRKLNSCLWTILMVQTLISISGGKYKVTLVMIDSLFYCCGFY